MLCSSRSALRIARGKADYLTGIDGVRLVLSRRENAQWWKRVHFTPSGSILS